MSDENNASTPTRLERAVRPLSERERTELAARVTSLGERTVAERTGVSTTSVTRAACGLPVTPGVRVLIERYLGDLDGRAA